ncbi:hypothetical protein CU098_000619, partial [Rhizopus stolonifer]
TISKRRVLMTNSKTGHLDTFQHMAMYSYIDSGNDMMTWKKILFTIKLILMVAERALQGRRMEPSNPLKSLLKLHSCDPQPDPPTEILHTVLLGIAEYLMSDLIKRVATRQETLQDLATSTSCCVGNTLSQMQVEILGRENEVLFLDEGFGQYRVEIDIAAKEFLKKMHSYDVMCPLSGHNGYSGKPKVHFLTHLPQDIKRFGTSLNFEIKKGEQFHKHIAHTNKTEVYKQLATRFGK